MNPSHYDATSVNSAHSSHFSHLPSPVSFREDINGLRAWAVIAVLLFHFSLIGLPGGFAGVDVFFVISGYLMTAIIVGGYEKGNFSVRKFYMARARRILPALMVVIATLLALGWFWLPTPDYQTLGVQSAFGLSFLSNIYYWRSAGYFDAVAHEKWLLHTWSLAVEAQFYVLYPLFVAIVWRFWEGLKALTIALLVLFTLSLTLNLVFISWLPTAAFYLLPMRGWELALGGLVYLIARLGWVSDGLKAKGLWLGWLLVMGSFAFINDSLAWPGYWAILPVLGAGLIILAQKENCWLTNNAAAQWLGDRSYSLYLWHWPLVVALYFAGLQSDWAWVVGFFALSLLLAHLSYRFVEVPTRSYLSAASLRKELFAIGAASVMIGLSAVAVKVVTFEGRINNNVEMISFESLNVNPRREECHTPAYGAKGSPGCIFGDFDGLGILLVGDSHAVSSVNPAVIASKMHSKNVKLWSFSSCPTISGIYRETRGTACADSTNWIISSLKQDSSEFVIVVNSGQYYEYGHFNGIGLHGSLGKSSAEEIKESYVSTICELSAIKKVYLVRPYPVMTSSVPQKLSRDLIFADKKDDVKVFLSDYYQKNDFFIKSQNMASQRCGVKILDPLPYLCDGQYCYGSKNGQPLYYDDNHLSEYGNKLLVPMFEQVFQAAQ